MNHPHDLLADLVDGTLDADRRAGVDAHLDTCEDCRADLAAATTGRDAARSLDAVPAPADLHERVMVAGGGARPRWSRWAGAAAAAAVIAAIALALPNVGSEPGSAGSADRRAAGAEQAPAAAIDAGGGAASVVVERQSRNYDERALRQLAKQAANGRSQAAAFSGAAKDGSTAVRCIERSLGTRLGGRLVRLIEARFAGTPAYIAVYLEGPGAGQPPDTSAVYVASKGDCRFLSTAAAKL